MPSFEELLAQMKEEAEAADRQRAAEILSEIEADKARKANQNAPR